MIQGMGVWFNDVSELSGRGRVLTLGWLEMFESKAR
jgi:hypothetical protein